jgi:iron(III) transport system permease protein
MAPLTVPRVKNGLVHVRRVSAAHVGAVLILVVVAAVVLVPIAVIAAGSVWSASFIGLPGSLTFANYSDILTAPGAFKAFADTAEMTLGASALALVLGGGQAWIIARTNVAGKAFLRWLPITPLLLSALVANFGWVGLYSPTTGIATRVLSHIGLGGLFNIYSMPGLIISLGTRLVFIPYLILLSPLSSMSQSLDEASKASGARSGRTMWSVTLPLLRPALLSSFTLTAILAAQAFETPLIIGAPAGIQTYVSQIYDSISANVDYGAASAQSIIYLILIGLLLVWNRRMTRNEARFALIAGRGHNPSIHKLGAARWALMALVLLIFLFDVVQLVGANVYLSLLPYYSVNRPIPPVSWTNYRTAWDSPGAVGALQASLVLGAVVAVITVVLGTVLAVIAYKTKMIGRRLAEELGTLPVAFPPLVFSIAAMITFLSIPAIKSVYNTLYLPIIVLVVVFLPFALRLIGAAVLSIDNSLLESARSSGASNWRSVRTIILPLIGTALIGAFTLVFIFSFEELGGIALITPPNLQLLPTYIYTLWSDGHLPTLYALNIITLLATTLALVIMGGCAYFVSRRVTRARASLAQFNLDRMSAAPDAATLAAADAGAPHG